jgi:hypothetical protein
MPSWKRASRSSSRLSAARPRVENDCSARCRSLRADRALELAYFVVVRRRKACLLAPPQHGEGRDPGLNLVEWGRWQNSVGKLQIPSTEACRLATLS